MMVAVVI